MTLTSSRVSIEGGIALADGHGACIANGLQSFRGQVGTLDICGIGRIVIRDSALAQVCAGEGLVQALALGWQRSGERLLDGLAGEFALAIIDRSRDEGMVAVDRFSTYAVYVAAEASRWAFACDPQRVSRLLGGVPRLNAAALHAYVYFHVIPAPLSIIDGVRRLDIGEMAVFRGGRMSVRTHWQARFDESQPFDFPTERGRFLTALRESVKEACGDVPRERLGCFLSGGTDSSTISGMATEHFGAGARTFSIGFDVQAYDESHYSRLASRHFGTEHTEFILTPAHAGELLDVIGREYEQPFGNASALPTFFCARLAGQAGIARMLGGDGGDELYGGNERYAKQWIFSLYSRVPSPLRAALLEPLLFGPLVGSSMPLLRKARGYIEQANTPLPDRLGGKYNLLNHFGAGRVFEKAVLEAASGFDPLALEAEVWSRCDAHSQINRLLAFDFKFTLGDSDLPKVTRMCHAAGVEVSFPMLSDLVTDHSLALAPGQKLRGTKLRYFFKESLRGFLPDEILTKPKHGFGMPFGDWMLSQPELSERTDEALRGLSARGIVRPAFIDELRESVRAGHAGYFGVMIWVLMSLELWLREHMPEASFRDVVS